MRVPFSTNSIQADIGITHLHRKSLDHSMLYTFDFWLCLFTKYIAPGYNIQEETVRAAPFCLSSGVCLVYTHYMHQDRQMEL